MKIKQQGKQKNSTFLRKRSNFNQNLLQEYLPSSKFCKCLKGKFKGDLALLYGSANKETYPSSSFLSSFFSGISLALSISKWTDSYET